MNVLGFVVPSGPSSVGDANGTAFTAPNRFEDALANGRLLVPVLLMGALALQNSLTSGQAPTAFQSLSREQFLGAAAGFLTYRVALLVSEVLSELRVEDLLGIIPGSLAEGFRRLQGIKSATEAAPVNILKHTKCACRDSLRFSLFCFVGRGGSNGSIFRILKASFAN